MTMSQYRLARKRWLSMTPERRALVDVRAFNRMK